MEEADLTGQENRVYPPQCVSDVAVFEYLRKYGLPKRTKLHFGMGTQSWIDFSCIDFIDRDPRVVQGQGKSILAYEIGEIAYQWSFLKSRPASSTAIYLDNPVGSVWNMRPIHGENIGRISLLNSSVDKLEASMNLVIPLLSASEERPLSTESLVRARNILYSIDSGIGEDSLWMAKIEGMEMRSLDSD